MRREQAATQAIHSAGYDLMTVTKVAKMSDWFLKTQEDILEMVAQAYNFNNKGDCHNNQILNHRLLQKGFVWKTCRVNTRWNRILEI